MVMGVILDKGGGPGECITVEQRVWEKWSRGKSQKNVEGTRGEDSQEGWTLSHCKPDETQPKGEKT